MSVPLDDSLDGVIGAELASDVSPDVTYRVSHRVGEGAMSVAFYATREAPDGSCPVVIKMMRPGFVQSLGSTAALIVRKEAIALGRLNERVPPTPFVVRFIDTGYFPQVFAGKTANLPWLALEYVHGGAEGTTLTQRVEHSIRATGHAFDPTRAAQAISSLASGLVAVHEVGVIHRDLKPDNVLCCGFGDAEIFKIADFGVARPLGMSGTFGGMMVGTLGYAAPELAAMDPKAIGLWSDVFSLAAVIYYLLTGEDYFVVSTPAQAIVAACATERRSIRDARGLCPELRAREQACRSIDFALACATSQKTENRPQRADAVAAMVLPWLRTERKAPHADRQKRLDAVLANEEVTVVRGFHFSTLHRPTQGMVVRSVAWDGDGKCLAATSEGLAFWDGTTMRNVELANFPNPTGIRFVRRVGPGKWLVGGDDATVATYTPEGVIDVVKLEGQAVRFDNLSGELDDLAVLVGSSDEGPPVLCALAARRWLKPLPLEGVAALMSVARIEDERWILAGRSMEGQGVAAIYSPLDWEVVRLPSASVRAYLASAGLWEKGVGLVSGAGGAVVWVQDRQAQNERVEGGFDLSSAGVDALGRGWVAALGRIWLRRIVETDAGAREARWERIYRDDTWVAPFISLMPDVGNVLALTADGGILEGRIAQGG